MSKFENKISDDKLNSMEQPREPGRNDPLDIADQLDSVAVPHGVDRRTFLMRTAVVGAAAVMTGALRVRRGRPGEAGSDTSECRAEGVAGGPGNVELSPSRTSSRNKKDP